MHVGKKAILIAKVQLPKKGIKKRKVFAKTILLEKRMCMPFTSVKNQYFHFEIVRTLLQDREGQENQTIQ